MCSTPVTLGGGTAMEKFSCGVPAGSGWNRPESSQRRMMRGSTSAGSKRVRSCRPDIRRLSLRSRGNRAPMADPFDRVGLVVHPARVLRRALATIDAWAARTGTEVRLGQAGPDDPEQVSACDLSSPSAATAPRCRAACRRARAPARAGRRLRQPGRAHGGHRRAPRRGAEPHRGRRRGAATLPALRVTGAVGEPQSAFNDLVLVRRGAGQVIVHVTVEGRARDALRRGRPRRRDRAGVDGLHPRGRRAGARAGRRRRRHDAPGPHGGCCPSVVTRAGRALTVTLGLGTAARVSRSTVGRGRFSSRRSPASFEVAHEPAAGLLIVLDDGEPFWGRPAAPADRDRQPADPRARRPRGGGELALVALGRRAGP